MIENIFLQTGEGIYYDIGSALFWVTLIGGVSYVFYRAFRGKKKKVKT